MCIIYMDYNPLTMNKLWEHTIFADVSTVMIPSQNLDDFCIMSNIVVFRTIKWSTANSLTLNVETKYNEGYNKLLSTNDDLMFSEEYILFSHENC
jgi:hypothetical protein